ncbi:MAG: glycerophosphodiester phosphodiesterase [Actinomycetes bacterium]
MNVRRTGARPFVIAHRGAARTCPENSIEALLEAVALGCEIVEFDVGSGLVLGHSLTERPPGAPTLDDVLRALHGKTVIAQIDMKVRGEEEAVAAAIARHGADEAVVVSSTWPDSLGLLARIAPRVSRAIGYPRDSYGAARVRWPGVVTRTVVGAAAGAMPVRLPLLAARGRPHVVALHHALVTARVVEAAHRRGLGVFAWTANDPALVERLTRAGVDAIASDDPEMALQVTATLQTP